MAQCLVNDVANEMDIWDCISKILLTRSHEETDPISAYFYISALASIATGDKRETCDTQTVSPTLLQLTSKV
jgi:hypothetical protein